MHRVGFVLTEGFQALSMATQSVFEMANLTAGEAFYEVRNYSASGGEVLSSQGLSIGTTRLDYSTEADTWIFTGAFYPLDQPTPIGEVAFARRVSLHSRRIAAICTGSFVLAEAGLLAGRRATTHWAYARDMQRLYPDIDVEDDHIYVIDGTVWTSAGMTAGLDLVLAMVEKDLGMDVARSVAHRLVMHQRRSGGQSQHSELLELSPKSDRIQKAIDHARKNLNKTLTVDDLAESANLSTRQFSRVFTAETGQSPAKAIEALRLEAARLMIEQSHQPLEVVARETGFRDGPHMRQAFMRGFGITPQAVRRSFRERH
jgi:transcriptional regulator GlxA family with amidase domain